ncbi:hypothetical protein D3C78_778690 [compost metagenome]
MQQAANFRVGQQHEFIDRIKSNSFVPFAAILLIGFKGQEFYIIRLIAFFLGNWIFRQSESAINLIFQTKQGVDPCSAKADYKNRIINRVYSNFVADDTSAKRNVQLLNMLSNDRLHLHFLHSFDKKGR